MSRGWPQLGESDRCDGASACQGRLLPDNADLLLLRHDRGSIAGDLVGSRGPLLLHQLGDHEQVGTRCCQLGRTAVAGRQSEWKDGSDRDVSQLVRRFAIFASSYCFCHFVFVTDEARGKSGETSN